MNHTNHETEPLEIEVTNMHQAGGTDNLDGHLSQDQQYNNNHHSSNQTAIINPDYEANSRNTITTMTNVADMTRNTTLATEITKDMTLPKEEESMTTDQPQPHQEEEPLEAKQTGSNTNRYLHPNHYNHFTNTTIASDHDKIAIHLNHLNISYHKPRFVYCAAELTLLKVDLQSQLFDAEIILKFYWQQPELTSFLSKQNYRHRVWILYDDQRSIPIDIDDPFSEDLGGEMIEQKFSFDFNTNTVCMKLHLKDKFKEMMQLQRFPVDRQFLNILLKGRKNVVAEGNWIWITFAPKWVPRKYQSNNLQVQARLGPSVSDYKLFSPWADFRIIQNGIDTQPPFKLRLRVQRYPGFYIGKIMIPLMFIVICCFPSLMIRRQNISDRLSVTITLMLTMVAFRFVLNSILPNVPYLTWMDHYITFSFGIVALFITENAIAGFMPNPLLSTDYDAIFFFMKNIDRIFGWIIGLCLFIVNIVFIVAMCTNTFRYSWKEMDQQDRGNDENDDFICADQEDVFGQNNLYVRHNPINSEQVQISVEATTKVTNDKPANVKVQWKDDNGDTQRQSRGGSHSTPL